MDDDSKIPIIGQSSKPNTTVHIPDEQLFTPRTKRATRSIKVKTRVILQPPTQTWVALSTKRYVTILVDSYMPIYTNAMRLAGTCIGNVEPDQPFRILIANFGDHPIALLTHQVVGAASTHPEKQFESHMSHGEVLGLSPDDRDTKFHKHHVNVRDIETINKHLAYQWEEHTYVRDKRITADDIEIDEPDDNKSAIREMLRKHERVWSGQLG